MVYLSCVVAWVSGLETGRQVGYNSFAHRKIKYHTTEKDSSKNLGTGTFE